MVPTTVKRRRRGRPLRAIIAAVSQDGAIGLRGSIPWHYSADMRRFKRLTTGATVIMGRLTFESMGSRPLPGRRNIVITRRRLPGVETYPSIEAALEACADDDVWFIGGRRIYEAAMAHADVIDLTIVPERVADPEAVRFPEVDEAVWQADDPEALAAAPRLQRRRYRRRGAGNRGSPPDTAAG